MSERIMSLDELKQAHFLTADKIGFVHDYAGNKIDNSGMDLLRRIIAGGSIKVKFLVTRNKDNAQIGIFPPFQTAVTGFYALARFVSGIDIESHELALNSGVLTYGSDSFPRPSPPLKVPRLYGVEIIGGGEIGLDPTRDMSYSLSLEKNYGISPLPLEHMRVVRRRVLGELGIYSFS